MNGSTNNLNGASTSNSKVSNGGRSAVVKKFAVGPFDSGLRHNVDISKDWTRQEQLLLEELLIKYASDSKKHMRYGKIAMRLQGKTVRDVAIRCHWMKIFRKKKNDKRRIDDNGSSRRQKVKWEKIEVQEAKPAFYATNHANGVPYGHPSASMVNDDVISSEDIAMSRKLLEQNEHALAQISANLSAMKVHDNINIFWQTRNNINILLNALNAMPGVMEQMPPLPEKPDDELAKYIFTRGNL
ncbi:hypothetical protein LXL04_000755 [Taraxacum kok-saghyz]